MSDCIFCRIAGHDLPADVIFEDEDIVAFRDSNPQAPVHVLFIPRRHISGIGEMESEDQLLMGKLLYTATRQAKALGLGEGYRVVINNGRKGGQHVFHIHLHLLGGRNMGWPPG
ncbi:MAG: histidine triad nucleotide-binding protein [Calditrichia bacterium]